MNNRRVLVVSNPVSGKGTGATGADVAEMLRGRGYEVDARESTADGGQSLYAAAKNYDVVVCCGGDGTLHHLVNGLLKNGSDVPVLYVPAGTTNDQARSLGLPATTEECLQLLEKDTTRTLDVGYFNQAQYFTYVASMGAFTDIAYTTPQKMKNRFGHNAYMLQGLANFLQEMRPIQARVSVDATEYLGEFLFCSITNATSIGGLLTMDSEKVRLDDGRFEVILIPKPMNSGQLWEVARALHSGSYLHGAAEGIHFFQTSHLRVETDEAQPWTLDGEFGGRHRAVSVDVLPGKQRLVCG